MMVIFSISFYANAGTIKKGSILIGGDSNFSFLFRDSKEKYDDGETYKDDDQEFELDLTMGFFPVNNFELGFVLGLNICKYKHKTSGTDYNYSRTDKLLRFSLGPLLGAHIPLNRFTNLFIKGALGLHFDQWEYDRGYYSAEEDGSGFFGKINFGADFFINDNVALDIGFKLQYIEVDFDGKLYDVEGEYRDYNLNETEFGPVAGIKVLF